jgi:hypothetical protein
MSSTGIGCLNISLKDCREDRRLAMKKLLCAILLFCSFISLFSQNRITLDKAINDFAVEFISTLSNPEFSANKNIAVISFQTNKERLLDYFFRTMGEKLNENRGNKKVYDRYEIETPLKEINFSLSRYVSQENAQEIGNFVGADTVIYGSFASIENEYRITITGVITETGQFVLLRNYYLRMDSRLARLIENNDARLWTLGVSAGSSFSRPLVMGTLHGTIAPFRYSFLELGVDVGFLSRKQDEIYNSIYPFAHYAFFRPFDKGGFYIGAGVGYLWGHIAYQDGSDPDTIRIIAADGIIGANIMNVIDISYTLRTTFKNLTNKFSVGYTCRFK